MDPSAKRHQALTGPVARKQIAKQGEALAARYLAARGYRLLCSNWRSGRFGEIDLIMSGQSGLLIFVEVKTRRRGSEEGSHDDCALAAYQAINWRKRRKIVISAQSYLARCRPGWTAARLDVVVVSFGWASLSDGEAVLDAVRISHIESAFDGA